MTQNLPPHQEPWGGGGQSAVSSATTTTTWPLSTDSRTRTTMSGPTLYNSDPAHAPEVCSGGDPRGESAPEAWRDPSASAPEMVWYPGLIPYHIETPEKEPVPGTLVYPQDSPDGDGNNRNNWRNSRWSRSTMTAATLRRRWWWVAALVAVLAVVGIVVGVVFGLGLQNRSRVQSSSPSSSSPTDDSGSSDQGSQTGGAPNTTTNTTTDVDVCGNTTCSQILAAAVLSSAVGSNITQLEVFARGRDGDIWRRSHNTSDWIDATWTAIGAGVSPSSSSSTSQPASSFVAEPAAVAWKGPDGPRINVFTVAANGTAFTAWRRGANASSDGLPVWSPLQGWDNISGDMASPLAACAPENIGRTRADVWGLSGWGQGLLHDMTVRNDTSGREGFMAPMTRPNWDGAIETDQRAGSKPALLCRDSSLGGDLMYLDGVTVKHRFYNDTAKDFGKPITVGEGFAAHPVVVSPRRDRVDFFGVSTGTGNLSTATWSDTGGWTEVYSLGGGLQSVPSVTSSGDSIDVVALGKDAKLKHIRLANGLWSSWENLDVFGSSAPLAVLVDGITTGTTMVALMVIGYNHQLNFTIFPLPADGKWAGKGEWKSAAGNLTTESMKILRT